MELREILKLNRKLGENYILVPKVNDGWLLARIGSNRLIMDSEKNTTEELMEFIKEHRKYNMGTAISRTTLIINTILIVMLVSNFFIKSDIITTIAWGVLITILPILIVQDVVLDNNRKVLKKVNDEDIDYLNKLHQELVEGCVKGTPSNKKTVGLNSTLKKNKSKTVTVKTKIKQINGENTTVTRKKVSSTPTTTRKPRIKGEEKKES